MAAFKLSLLVLLLLYVVALSSSVVSGKQDPELKQCRHQCKHQTGFDEQQKSLCEQRCEEYVREKKELERRERGGREEEEEEERHSSRREREEIRRDEGERVREPSPYVFEDEHFETSVRTEEGRVHILRKFTEKSKLLKGIENYRVGFLEANPNTFIAPVHFDADTIFFVANGKFSKLIPYFVF